jgi:cell division protein FtsB
LDRSLAADADFLSAYDAAIYEPLEAWSVRELIQRIRERDRDVDLLHAETRELRERTEGLEGENARLRAEIVQLSSNGAPAAEAEVAAEQEPEDEEADAFAEGF